MEKKIFQFTSNVKYSLHYKFYKATLKRQLSIITGCLNYFEYYFALKQL